MIDPESGQTIEVPTQRRDVRDRFAQAARDQRAEISAALRRAGAGHLTLRTDREWLLDIVKYVANRRHTATGGASR